MNNRFNYRSQFNYLLLKTRVVCIVFLAGVGATATAQNQDKVYRHSGGQSFAGTFFVRESDSNTNWRIITLGADGNWSSIASNQTKVPDFDVGYTDQQGAWKRTGHREITATVLNFDFDPTNGEHSGNSIAIYNLTLSRDFNELIGSYSGKEFPPDQNPLDPDDPGDFIPFGGRIDGKRVPIDY
jgi:hypothetical protein